jgi:hypothetical protein
VLQSVVPHVLVVIGLGFLVANLRLCVLFWRHRRLRVEALLTWPGRRPPYFGLVLGMAVVLGILVFVELVVQRRPPIDVFGEAMMFVYYGYLLPLSARIGRGIYASGVWADSRFVPFADIGGLSWREGPQPTLLLVPRQRRVAFPLAVPRAHFAAVRRILRDKIAEHQIHISGRALDLDVAHDARDAV